MTGTLDMMHLLGAGGVLPDSDVGIWLAEARGKRGLSQFEVAERAGVTQEYVSGIERGLRNPSRKVLTALAAAVTPEGADEETARRILNAGLLSRGFASSTEITHELDPDLQMIVENWDGMSATGKRAVKSAAELALEMSRENSIGGRRAE